VLYFVSVLSSLRLHILLCMSYECAKTLPNTKTINQIKWVYSGKSNILPTHCGLLLNPPPSPLKFTYTSSTQSTACQMTLMWALHNKENIYLFITLLQMIQFVLSSYSFQWKLYKNVEVQKAIFNQTCDGNIHISNAQVLLNHKYPSPISRHADASKSVTPWLENLAMATILTPYTHSTPHTSCD
jgi:hypothetical protein